MTLRGLLLRRRRWDAFLLAVGAVCLAVMATFGKFVFLFFAVCGFYLAVLRPRSLRTVALPFTVALAGWSLWQIGLSLARGEPLLDNRLLSYAGLEFACAFLPLGLGLVRRPSQVLAMGARCGLIVLALLAPLEYAITGARVGLGENEAIFAFVVGATGLVARLPTSSRLRLLPDGRFWTYLAAVPIILSGTRAAMLMLVIVAVLDLRRMLPRLRSHGRRGAIALVGGLVVAMVAVVPVASFLADRLESGVAEFEAYEATGLAVGSVDVRLAMWSSALHVLSEHPFIGVGAGSRMAAVAQDAGPNGGIVLHYQHLHNLVLDESLSSGLIGLVLMCAVFVLFLSSVFRHSDLQSVRDTAVALVTFSFVFGLFHGVLLNEWMILAIFGSMGTILAELSRRTPFGPKLGGVT